MRAPADAEPAGSGLATAEATLPHPRQGAEPSTALVGLTMAAIVLVWGLGVPVQKLITAPPFVSVAVRYWMSVPVLLVLVFVTGGRLSWSTLRHTFVAGLFYGANMTFTFAAVQHASVAVVTVIFALQPGLILLLAGRWMGERATAWHVFWTFVGIAGVIALVVGGDPEVRGEPIGVVHSIIGMLAFLMFSLVSRRVRSTVAIDPLPFMAGTTLVACLAVTPVALVVSSPSDFRQVAGLDWFYLAFVGLGVGIVGHTMMSWATKFVAASRSSLVLLGVNVVSVFAAWPLHDEPVTILELVSGAVVLGAVTAVISRPAGVRLSLVGDTVR